MYKKNYFKTENAKLNRPVRLPADGVCLLEEGEEASSDPHTVRMMQEVLPMSPSK